MNNSEDTKMVIVIRKDLNMRKGKSCSQAAHASMKVFFDRMKKVDSDPFAFESNGKELYEADFTPEMLAWMAGAFTRVTISVNSEAELDSIYEQAKAAGIPCSMIVDSGFTEFHGVPTKTCVAIGPDLKSKLDLITGNLQLL